jgi:DNA-directed RNA polymerase subunit M/transcription elongation factor TFIIS
MSAWAVFAIFLLTFAPSKSFFLLLLNYRNCGYVFCHKCSNHFYPLPHQNLNTPVRICVQCKFKIDNNNKVLNKENTMVKSNGKLLTSSIPIPASTTTNNSMSSSSTNTLSTSITNNNNNNNNNSNSGSSMCNLNGNRSLSNSLNNSQQKVSV